MQRIYRHNASTIQCKWYYCETVLCREVLCKNPHKENNSMKKIMPQHQVPLVLKFIFLFRSWIPTIHPAYHRILTYLILLSLTFLVPLMKLYWIKVFNEFFGSMYISMYSERKSKSLFFLNPPIRVIKHRQL